MSHAWTTPIFHLWPLSTGGSFVKPSMFTAELRGIVTSHRPPDHWTPSGQPILEDTGRPALPYLYLRLKVERRGFFSGVCRSHIKKAATKFSRLPAFHFHQGLSLVVWAIGSLRHQTLTSGSVGDPKNLNKTYRNHGFFGILGTCTVTLVNVHTTNWKNHHVHWENPRKLCRWPNF